MFIGIDHGTTAMRFAGDGAVFKIPRKEAVRFQLEDLSRLHPVSGLSNISGIALTYSMGDNFSSIIPVRAGKNKRAVYGTRIYMAPPARRIERLL